MSSSYFRAASLSLALGLATTLAPARAQTPASLPPAKEIVSRYDEALGGRAAIKNHSSSTMKGNLVVQTPNGPVTIPFLIYAAAPYRRLEKYKLPNGLESMNGFDGGVAWTFNPRTGAQITTGDERESVKRDADFYYALDELSWFKTMETVGVEEFEGRPCYRLNGINNWGKPNTHFYDTQTGLLAGYEFDSEWRGGPGIEHEVFSDYKRVDGVLIPMKLTFKAKQKGARGEFEVEQTLTLTSVSFNDVDSAVFALPPAVKAVLEKQSAVPSAPRN